MILVGLEWVALLRGNNLTHDEGDEERPEMRLRCEARGVTVGE